MTKETRIIMGMPITLSAVDSPDTPSAFNKAFRFFESVDKRYSPFIESSEVSKINRREIQKPNYSKELQKILAFAEKTKYETNGYFDVWHNGVFDPSGIVKGWAIQKAYEQMSGLINNFYIDAGGDIQTSGTNDNNQPWRIGVRNPFDRTENISIVSLSDYAIATSGTAIRGQHIYNPFSTKPISDIISLSVIAKNIIDADRMATAAFAMGQAGIEFIERLPGYEAYLVTSDKQAVTTSGWRAFEIGMA